MPVFIHAKNIGCYSAITGELDPISIINEARRLGKKLFLPVIPAHHKSMTFYTCQCPLVKNAWNILEPNRSKEKPINIDQLDIIFVPMVGFDEHGNRIGRGVGYYDRCLSQAKKETRPVFIGLAYESQQYRGISPDSWDVPMDMIVTEKNLYSR